MADVPGHSLCLGSWCCLLSRSCSLHQGFLEGPAVLQGVFPWLPRAAETVLELRAVLTASVVPPPIPRNSFSPVHRSHSLIACLGILPDPPMMSQHVCVLCWLLSWTSQRSWTSWAMGSAELMRLLQWLCCHMVVTAAAAGTSDPSASL